MTVDTLPDEVLLAIFHFRRDGPQWWWKTLADVCRRWRDIIFASPHALGLGLVCTCRTPTRTSLDIWPPIPITIFWYSRKSNNDGRDNIIAALERRDRIIWIRIEGYGLQELFAVAERPFPILKELSLSSDDEIAPVLNEEFLAGSAPHLRYFTLMNIGFPAFPKLALSTTYLSTLDFWDIPMSGYISPEAMVTCLATLPNLRTLRFGFSISHPPSHPDLKSLPLPKRTVLSALTLFSFKGVSEYLEDFVARIDTPKLNQIDAQLQVDPMIHIPHLCNFISRLECIRPLNPARLDVSSSTCTTTIILGSLAVYLVIIWEPGRDGALMTAQMCSQLSPHLSHVEELSIWKGEPGLLWWENPMQWFELFDHFPAMKHLHLESKEAGLPVARALQGITGERATEVLPSLRSLFFHRMEPSRHIQDDIQPFIVARQQSNYPVDVQVHLE